MEPRSVHIGIFHIAGRTAFPAWEAKRAIQQGSLLRFCRRSGFFRQAAVSSLPEYKAAAVFFPYEKQQAECLLFSDQSNAEDAAIARLDQHDHFLNCRGVFPVLQGFF